MDGRPRPARRLPPVTFLVVLAALLLGVAAALLAGAPPTPAHVATSSGGFVAYWQLEVFADVVIGLLVVSVAYRVIQRIRDPSGAQLLRGPVLAFAICLLVALGFLVAVHFVGGNGYSPTTVPGGPGNTTVTPPAPPSRAANSTPSNFTVHGETFPGWVVYAVVLGVAVLAAFVAVPLAVALGRKPEATGPSRSAADEARAAIAATLAELEADPNADPRALIVALYARLLASVDARAVETHARTAREIEATIVGRWRIPPDAAGELTRLFEEARYSAHPLGPEETGRARAAFGRILDALDRSPVR